mmetsp:Transcript_7432/g.13364  ORF Transcript_7432/g.13364 Transcript_7432/m.13364 type:complete len:208 (-) Transcript_7432:1103-1726(-)
MSELRARVKSRRRPALGINLSVVNGVHMQSPVHMNNVGGQQKGEDLFISPLKTTYRAEGLSIGQNYLRFEGSTMPTDLSPADLIVDDKVIGRGSCSIVQRAHIRDDPQERQVALKIFIIRDVNCMDMMVKELRTLCSIQCDCLVTFMGAFFNPREAIITMVGYIQMLCYVSTSIWCTCYCWTFDSIVLIVLICNFFSHVVSLSVDRN